jgi:hypothetical protein
MLQRRASNAASSTAWARGSASTIKAVLVRAGLTSGKGAILMVVGWTLPELPTRTPLQVLTGVHPGERIKSVGVPWNPLQVGPLRSPHRKILLYALASVRDWIAIAVLLDRIAQLLIFHEVHPGATLLLGPLLVGMPCALSRKLGNRLSEKGAQLAQFRCNRWNTRRLEIVTRQLHKSLLTPMRLRTALW